MVTGVLARGDRAVPNRPSQLGAFGDLLDQPLGALGVAPAHLAGVHVDRDGGTGLDGVETELVTEAIEVGDVLPAGDGAVRTEQREGLEFEGRRLVPALCVVDDVAALHDAAGHAIVHGAAALLEALVDAGAIQRLDVRGLSAGAVLVREGVKGVRHGDHSGGPRLEHLGTIQVALGVALGELCEGLAIGGLAQRGASRIDHHVLEPLLSHHGAETTARRVSGGVAVVLVGAGHRRTPESELSGGPAGDEGCGLRVPVVERLAERVVPHPLVLIGGNHLDPVDADFQGVSTLGIGGGTGDDDGPEAELHQMLPRLTAGIRLLDSAGERALAADRDAARGRGCGPGEHAWRHHQKVFGSERIAGGIALRQQDLGRECSPAEQPPPLGKLHHLRGLAGHIDADQPVAARS